ncbi:MAG: DUF1638 domain-containing protein [Gemmatimonadota bacterium]
MFLKVVACEVVFREVCYCAARSPNQVDLEFLSQGYHDNPEVGLARLQAILDAAEPGRFDAILMGYGLCNNMLAGLRAPSHTRVVIPRAHDCITFFYGSKERYRAEFDACPGTYVYTSGWLEHRERGGERPQRPQSASLGGDQSYAEMVARYGEDNAQYLQQFLGNWTSHYNRGVYINFDFTAHLPYREQARQICADRGWEFVEIDGDLGLIQAWLDGPWPGREFLVVEPGQRVIPSYDDAILQITPAG